MTANYFLTIWSAWASAVGNHLWQSTLFAVAIWLLTLLWRRNQARARYWLWLAASVKFLIPFSLLIALGSRWTARQQPAENTATFYWAMEQVSRPFTRPMLLLVPPGNHAAVSSSRMDLLPTLLVAAWLCGLFTVLLLWFARWRRISMLRQGATPLLKGREIEALRRLESEAKHGTAILLSRTSLEPGIVGIVRPVLLWPEGISERLSDEHLETILAHELAHVRRRDNLTAALHMLVEAIFWFHPLVWWLGARLVEERECACDEEVLVLGSRRQVYAESILKTCEFCVEAPLVCVSGVTGADLKNRVVRIMTQRLADKLSFSRKLLLAAFCAVALGAPVVFGLLHAPQVEAQSQETAATASPVFDVASIKLNKSGTDFAKILFTRSGMSVENLTVHSLIYRAWEVQENQIIGEPGWLNSDKYDIEAKVDPALAGPGYAPSDRRLALQQLLIDRCKLKLHRETRELPVYELVIARDGPKIKPSKAGDLYTDGVKVPTGRPIGPGLWSQGRGNLTSQGMELKYLLSILSRNLDRPILDKTGLTGKYDYTLQWAPEESPAPGGDQAAAAQPASLPESSGPSIFIALREQLGLKLEAKKGPVEVLVIDHVEKPSEN